MNHAMLHAARSLRGFEPPVAAISTAEVQALLDDSFAARDTLQNLARSPGVTSDEAFRLTEIDGRLDSAMRVVLEDDAPVSRLRAPLLAAHTLIDDVLLRRRNRFIGYGAMAGVGFAFIAVMAWRYGSKR